MSRPSGQIEGARHRGLARLVVVATAGAQLGHGLPLGGRRVLSRRQGLERQALGLAEGAGVPGLGARGRRRVAGVGAQRGRGRLVAGVGLSQLARGVVRPLPERLPGVGVPELVGAHGPQPGRRLLDLGGGAPEPAPQRRHLIRVTGHRIGARQRAPVGRAPHQPPPEFLLFLLAQGRGQLLVGAVVALDRGVGQLGLLLQVVQEPGAVDRPVGGETVQRARDLRAAQRRLIPLGQRRGLPKLVSDPFHLPCHLTDPGQIRS